MFNLPSDAVSSLSLIEILMNLGVCAVLSFILSWHFVRFGSTFSNRTKFARVLAPLALTTTLVICVVKASLALSLGLVGALSIVRFRTPIKEPEELAYLFLAIAIGLGTGADHRVVTSTAILAILGVLAARVMLRRRGPGKAEPGNLYLNVEVQDTDGSPTVLKDLVGVIGEYAQKVDVRRFDVHDHALSATFFMECRDLDALTGMQEKLRERYPTSVITFVDQSSMPGV